MNVQTAVLAYAQSDKIKSGLIWASHLAGMHAGLSDLEKRGATITIQTLLAMIADEIHLARRTAGGRVWETAEKHMDLALVMAHSGVIAESAFHMTRALGAVNDAGGRAMAVLKQHRII
jgi:chloramphenicol 3-O-phosphotransferase